MGTHAGVRFHGRERSCDKMVKKKFNFNLKKGNIYIRKILSSASILKIKEQNKRVGPSEPYEVKQ